MAGRLIPGGAGRPRTPRALLALAVGLALLAGCQGAPAAAPTPTAAGTHRVTDGPYNETDVMFLQMMLPHHHQGIEIAGLARDRPVRQELKDLAAAIVVTQAAERETMTGWLTGWGQPLTGDPNGHAAHGGMPGTTEGEIAALARKSGVEFERGLLNMLIAHQDDAIQVARMETNAGADRRARELAARIDQSRTAQIQQMLALLG
ncbi:DUF305 domain-containing protein [Longispora sp. K20-0274]|uniref:DUF305 domain-containing protein n=1 Tax=Longispora sp. K20-0274 TaxID=3088255 RepID=UPI00399B36C3